MAIAKMETMGGRMVATVIAVSKVEMATAMTAKEDCHETSGGDGLRGDSDDRGKDDDADKRHRS